MNTQCDVDHALSQALNKAVHVAGEATDFMSAELPEYVQQLLMWKMATHSIMLVLCGSVVAGSIFWILRIKSLYHRDEHNWTKKLRPSTSEKLLSRNGLKHLLWCVACVIVCFSFTVYNAVMVLQIWIAPHVYITEYAVRLINNNP